MRSGLHRKPRIDQRVTSKRSATTQCPVCNGGQYPRGGDVDIRMTHEKSRRFLCGLIAFRALLPARANSHSDANAAWANTDADAGTIVVVAAAAIVSPPLNVSVTRSIIVAVTVFLLNDDPPTAPGTVAATIFIANQSHIFDSAVRKHHRAAYSFTTEENELVLRRYSTNACQRCAVKQSCTTGRSGESPDGSMNTFSKPFSVDSTSIRRRCASGARRSKSLRHHQGRELPNVVTMRANGQPSRTTESVGGLLFHC